MLKMINAYARLTRTGHKVYRIKVDTNEILSYLEHGKTIIGIDIVTSKGSPKIVVGRAKNSGKPYEAIQYYTWAIENNQQEVQNATPVESTVS